MFSISQTSRGFFCIEWISTEKGPKIIYLDHIKKNIDLNDSNALDEIFSSLESSLKEKPKTLSIILNLENVLLSSIEVPKHNYLKTIDWYEKRIMVKEFVRNYDTYYYPIENEKNNFLYLISISKKLKSNLINSSNKLGFELINISVDLFSAGIGLQQIHKKYNLKNYVLWKIQKNNYHSLLLYKGINIKSYIKCKRMNDKIVSKQSITKREIIQKEVNDEMNTAIDNIIKDKISSFNKPKNKHQRYSEIDLFIEEVQSQLDEKYPESANDIKSYVNHAISNDLRRQTINDKKRADGRDLVTVRDIDIETSLLPRAHGSSLFTRGETQAIVAATLGGKRDEQMMDNIEGLTYKRFMLHYNFPSYCVGEARGKFSLSRREVGHGNLAERAITPSLPEFEIFPYTLRLVSEITESNGSSSMATVCGSSLALMDAGVPIKAPIAGVAMGLIMDDDTGKYAILTDILGTEDHIGDMDFKVAGSIEGITAIQMDIKVVGLSYDILKDALNQAKDGRLHILEKMNDTIATHREKLSSYAPKIMQSNIPVDEIGGFIGPGGKNIKGLAEKYECEINIEDDGSCTILGTDQEKLDEVLAYINKYNMKLKIGEVYEGEVVKILDFGAFVQLTPNKDGLVHISEIKKERIDKVSDHLEVGQTVKVKLIKIDDRTGKLSLSIKSV